MTKNFQFLQESREFDEKENLIQLINEIELEAKKEKCDMSRMSNFRHLYFALLKMYCKYNKDIDESLISADPYDQWEAIRRFCDQQEAQCFRRIKDAGNIGSHDNVFMADQLDIIHYLKSTFLLLKHIMIQFDFIKNLNYSFDKTCYTGGLDKTKQAFSNKDLKKWDDESTKCDSSFVVQRLPIVQLINEPILKFDIPIYQRGYSWDKNNIDALLKDIEKRQVDNLDHYFGVIAYKLIKQDKLLDPNKTLSILDGQQRLTTCSILLCAIRDVLIKKGRPDFLTVNASFKNPAGREIDNDTFKFIKLGKIECLNKFHKATNYFKNYMIFYDYLSKKTCDEIIDFYNAFKENFRVGGIEFKSISKKNEMEIFENLNSKGKSLTTLELTKNFIFNLCSESTLLKEETTIALTFDSMFKETEKLGKDNMEKSMTMFFESLIHYATGKELLKSGKDVDQINYLSQLDLSLQNLYLINFNKTMPKSFEIDEYKDFIDVLTKYLKIFLTFYSPSVFDNSISKECGLKPIYELIPVAKRNPIYPCIYLVYDVYKLDGFEQDLDSKTKTKIKYTIFNCIKYLIWHDSISGAGHSDTARKYWEIVNSILIKDEFRNLTSYQKLTLMEEKIKNEIAMPAGDWKARLLNVSEIKWSHKSLLVLIEWELLGGIDSQIHLSYDKPSWEHVMPQENSKWIDDLKKWNPQLNDDEIKVEFESHVNKLGNAIRLPKNWNSKLNNNPFAEKIKKINSLCEFNSPLFTSSNNKIDISHKQKWNFDDIDIRHNELIKIIEEKIFK